MKSFIIFGFMITAILCSLQAQETGLPFNYAAGQLKADAMAAKFESDSIKTQAADYNPEFSLQRKSPGKAFLYSLILPGSGEYYLGYNNRAALFFGIDIVAWSGLIANSLYADHLESEYQTYAVQHAHVNSDGKDKQYWIDIGKFDNIYEFNDIRERDRFFDRLYEDEDFYYWQWDSRENRFTYDAKRIHNADVKNRDIFFIGALILNRLTSAVHSMAMARKYNRNLEETTSWRLHFDSQSFADKDAYFKVQFSARF